MIRWLKLGGLLVFVALLLAFGPELSDITAVFAGLHPAAWLLAVALYALALLVSAFRLSDVVEASGSSYPRLRLFADIVRASALNTFLLYGTGEAYKAARLRQACGSGWASLGLVLFDRAIGLAAQLTALFAALLLVPMANLRLSHDSVPFTVTAVAIGGGCVAIALLWLYRRDRLQALVPFLSNLLTRPIMLLRVSALSLLIVALLIGSVGVLVAGAGLHVAMSALFVAVPLVTVASLLPITVGGLGVRESGYVLALQSASVSQADCIALGLMQYSVFIAVALVGALLLGFQFNAAVPPPDNST